MDALAAHDLWVETEPFHSMVYFTPEPRARYEALGLDGAAGYFASRSAAMGPVAGPVVAAAFYGFNPMTVSAQISAAWELTEPSAVIAARLDGAEAALRRMAGDRLEDPAISEAAGIATSVAAGADTAGRPLAAAWQSVLPPDSAVGKLWLAMAVLREHRGDGHVAVLVSEGISPVEAHQLVAAEGRADGESLRKRRGWSQSSWDAGTRALVERGLLDEEGALTDAGRALTEHIEHRTSTLAAGAWTAAGSSGVQQVIEALRPVVDAVIEGDGLRYPNPAGLPPRPSR